MQKNERFYFVDLLRGLALFVMIEVHIINALGISTIRSAWWFPALNFINGLVAPAFIFISGFAFTLNLKAESSGFNLIKKRAGRILLILLVGYSIHTPAFSMRYLIYNAEKSEIKNLFNVDVLQCIALGLSILLIARFFIHSQKGFQKFSFLSTLIVILTSPFIWEIDFSEYIPLMTAAYFNEINGSFFPLFPWLGFMFSGALTASLYLSAIENSRKDKFMKNLTIFGITTATTGLCTVLYLKGFNWFEIKPSPFFFIERLGTVIVFLSICYVICNKIDLTKSIFMTVSRESLLVYWLHLQLIYRKIYGGKSLNEIYSNQLEIPECLVITLLLAISMIIIALIWSTVKKKYPIFIAQGSKCFIAILIIIFILK